MRTQAVSPGAETCAVHAETAADFQCGSCGALLCGECLVEGSHLLICGLCGERAYPIVRANPYADADDVSPYREPSVAVELTNHVVVPGAIIAMVASLLFFLVDVRSVFLPFGGTLKWVGFCFVVATVLIERYGRVSGSEEGKGLYTALLGVAMLIVLGVQPWERRSTGIVDFAVNVAIVLAVWRFATRLTASLSREGEERPEKKGLRLYGVERLKHEAWEREQDDARLAVKRQQREAAKRAAKGRGGADAHGNPSAAVARLAAAALAVFALAEPVLLAAPPAAGERALAATAVFLLAAGVVLAAGSAVGTLRHARRLGGRVSEGLVASRVALGGFVMVVLLALALAVPGVAYRGTGELAPEKPRADATASERGAEGEAQDAPPEGRGDRGREASAGQPVQAATSILDFLATLGRWLWVPVVIFLALGGLYVLARLAPFLARLKLSGWRGWLAGLAAVLGRRRTRHRRRRRGRGPRVELDLDGLGALDPRAAVVTGYTRLLAAFGGLGYERPERSTPYEYLEELPLHLRHLRPQVAGLTELYVRAAYGAAEPGEAERLELVSALAEIKRGLRGVSAET